MKVEALNCPNCGGNVSSDSSFCRFCGSRLKTEACRKCLGLMFIGAKHCVHCGEPVAAIAEADVHSGKCPRCECALDALSVADLALGQCSRCEGIWIDVPTFERVCADQEKQAAILGIARPVASRKPAPVRYVPCPVCRDLMNRSNFARSSGVIIDTCRKHGVWCDADELPRIVEFIRAGGVDRQRRKEKAQLEEQRRELLDLEREETRRASRLSTFGERGSFPASTVKEFLRLIFD